MKTRPPRWGISPHWSVIMGWTWAKPSQGKKKLLSEQFTGLASSHPQWSSSLIRVALKEMFLIHLLYLVLVALHCLAQTQWLQFQKDGRRKTYTTHDRRKELLTATFPEDDNFSEKGNCHQCYWELVKYTDLYEIIFLVGRTINWPSV